jgi:hypothetical protein
MRRKLNLCIIALFCTALYASAETWQMDSGPFFWPGEAVPAVKADASAPDRLSWRYMPGKKIVFECPFSEPAQKHATVEFRIYSLDGARIYSREYNAGVRSVVWEYGDTGPGAASTFIATVKAGAIDHTTKFTAIR